MKIKIKIFLFLILVFINTVYSNDKKPKNIIFLISDGCGYNHIIATDYYQYGKRGQQVYEKFPFISAMSTYLYGDSYDFFK